MHVLMGRLGAGRVCVTEHLLEDSKRIKEKPIEGGANIGFVDA